MGITVIILFSFFKLIFIADTITDIPHSPPAMTQVFLQFSKANQELLFLHVL